MRNKSDYEVIRDDKFFELTIPKFEKNGDAVFYEVHLKDLVSHRDYVRLFRFNEFKDFYDSFKKMEVLLLVMLDITARIP